MGVFVKYFSVAFSKLFCVRDKQRVWFSSFSVFCSPSCSDLVKSSVCVCRGGSPSTEGSPHSWLLGAQQSRSSPTSEVCFVLKGREGVKNHPFRVIVYWYWEALAKKRWQLFFGTSPFKVFPWKSYAKHAKHAKHPKHAKHAQYETYTNYVKCENMQS